MSDQGPTQYDEGGRSIAFLDILGFSEHVKRAQDPGYFPTLLTALRTVKSVGDTWPTVVGQEGIPPEEMQKALDFRSHTFSDSIVLSERGKMVAPLIFAVARLAMALLKDGVYFRGGIAVGALHHDETVVFGPAFLQAYDLEHTAAKYPRVLLTDTALEIARQNAIKFPGYALTHRVDQFVALDTDGLYYVDFLKLALAGPEAVAGVRRGQLGSVIIPALERAQKERDEAKSQYVRANLGWLAHYLEKFVSEHIVKGG
jgi:hypothetical protein